MKTSAMLIGAVATLALASNANAATFNGWYVGLEAGANWVQDATAIVDAFSPPPSQGGSTFKTGWAGLGTLGYAWDGWRGELELGYRASDIDRFASGTGLIVNDPGEFNEFSQMLNFVYDNKVGRNWAVSFGLGGGGDRIEYKNAGFHTVAIEDTDWVFAWQILAGVNYHLNERTDLFVDYRLFNAEGPEFTEVGPDFVHSDAYDTINKHTVTIGLRFALWDAQPRMEGGSDADTGLPAKEFIVFFGHNKSTLVPHALDVIHEAAATAQIMGSATIAVVGHADRSGSAAYNDALSQRRSKVVKDALVSKGVPRSAISVSAKGENDPLVPTADGVREPQNRRVNIEM